VNEEDNAGKDTVNRHQAGQLLADHWVVQAVPRAQSRANKCVQANQASIANDGANLEAEPRIGEDHQGDEVRDEKDKHNRNVDQGYQY
jgi:hypothetical protein